MHKGGKEKMGEMVIRISFFLLPSFHFTLAFVCNQTAKKAKRRQVQLIGSCISPPFGESGAGLQKGVIGGGSFFDPVKHNTVV